MTEMVVTMPETYQINPAVGLNVIDENVIQFRFPNSNHITLRHSSSFYGHILDKTGTLKPKGWMDVIADAGVAANEVEDVFSMLTDIGVLVDGERPMEDHLDALLAHEDVLSKFSRHVLQLPAFQTVSVAGDGVIADAVRDFVSEQKDFALVDEGEFRIIVADEERIGVLSELWKSTKGAKFAAAVWSDGISFRFGPLWVPNESACFECFLDRSRASSQFPEEFEAMRSNKFAATKRPKFTQGQMGLLTFALERYLRLIYNGLFDVVEPGVIENLNFFGGDRKVQRVLRNPYCDNCSAGSMSSRAVRDLQ